MPILTVDPKKAVEPLPPAVKVTVTGRKLGTMLFTPSLSTETGVTVAVRETEPENEPVLTRLTVDAAVLPRGTDSLLGVRTTVKSDTGTTTDSTAPPVIDSE